MNQYTINYIKNNPLIYNYLREKPEWYKELNRDGSNIKIQVKLYFSVFGR